MKKHRTYFNWSTGKDSSLALYHLLQNEEYSIDYLLTSVNAHFDRVTKHGLPVALLKEQVKSIGIQGGIVALQKQPNNEQYAQLMAEKVNELIADNFDHAAFGDIFLEDLKAYREQQLHPLGIQTIFPLWKRNTKELIHVFIDLGF